MKRKNGETVMNRITEYAYRQDRTFDEICREAGVDKSSIYRWRMGLGVPNVISAIRIARVFGVSVEDIWPV